MAGEILDTVWSATLDGRYQIEVLRTGDYTATLTITDDNGDLLLSEPTTLSYRALFGPDVGDIADWQERASDFIDNRTTG